MQAAAACTASGMNSSGRLSGGEGAAPAGRAATAAAQDAVAGAAAGAASAAAPPQQSLHDEIVDFVKHVTGVLSFLVPKDISNHVTGT